MLNLILVEVNCKVPIDWSGSGLGLLFVCWLFFSLGMFSFFVPWILSRQILFSFFLFGTCSYCLWRSCQEEEVGRETRLCRKIHWGGHCLEGAEGLSWVQWEMGSARSQLDWLQCGLRRRKQLDALCRESRHSKGCAAPGNSGYSERGEEYLGF